MAWTYVTTSDWRISEQEKWLIDTANWYLTDNERKSENVPCTLALLFGLKNKGICAQKASKGDLFPVYLNFIKKFQFPNPKPRNYKETINDGILLAPLREIIKVLYYLNDDISNSYLTYNEISNFILYNPKVAKSTNINYTELIDDILNYRATEKLPDYIALDNEKNSEWISNPLGRSLRELIQILSFTNFILDIEQIIKFKNFETYENYIKSVIDYNDFLNIEETMDKEQADKLYLEYLNRDFLDTSIQVVTENNILTPEWFRIKAQKYTEDEKQAKYYRERFQNEFSIEKLKSLSGIELLNKLFLNGSKDNLCYKLEYDKENVQFFGSIKGGNAYKYGLFYSDGWKTGTVQNSKDITEDEAILIGTEIRNNIVRGAEILENFSATNIDEYKTVFNELKSLNILDKVWILKYYQMLYPQKIPTFYNDNWVNSVLDILNISIDDIKFINLGNIALFIKECNISNVAFAQIIYNNIDSLKTLKDYANEENIQLNYATNLDSKFKHNRILFGAPGTGKSYTLNKEKDELLCDGGEFERVTFHPDYSYANFVGTYKPVPDKDKENNDTITYKYVPGPFIRTYVKALKNAKTENPKPFLLIIEEINRANVAAVFGDIFQLLDRDDNNTSEYSIQTSEDLKKYLVEELGGDAENYNELKIPNNMFIWATMNSADQGVFPMDTAFKRRWDFKYIGINDGANEIINKYVKLGKNEYAKIVEWNSLRVAINEKLSNLRINEDKLLGPYFICLKNVIDVENDSINSENFSKIFKNKVLMYLFDDAAKQKKAAIFAEGIDINKYSEICKEFDNKGISIFCSDIQNNCKSILSTEGEI